MGDVMKMIDYIIQYIMPTGYRIKHLRNKGLRIGNGCEIYRSVNFGSEPYLISIGNDVRITSGVKFCTHDGGIWTLRKKGLLQDVVVPIMERYKELIGKYKRIAVVGTPCQINSLQRVKKAGMKILSIGVTCSSGTSYLATQEYKHLMKATDSVMYYRGNGWPGYNSLYMGEESIENYHTGSLFERMFSSQIFKNPGCRKCSDHFAENADISFCDFWNAEEMSTEKIGNSCVIVRSKCGKRIFDDMISEGVVSVVRELEKKEVIKSQYGVLKAKKGNLKKKSGYTLFIWMIDIVRKTKVFRLFGLREYQKIAATYSKLCNKSSLDFKDDYID